MNGIHSSDWRFTNPFYWETGAPAFSPGLGAVQPQPCRACNLFPCARLSQSQLPPHRVILSRFHNRRCSHADGPQPAEGKRPARGAVVIHVGARAGWPVPEGNPTNLSEMFFTRCP